MKRITRSDVIGIKKAVPYSYLQYTLKFFKREGYNAGLYGWNYDYYHIGKMAILTGYRPEGKKVDPASLYAIEQTAKSLINDGALDDPGKAYNARALLTGLIELL